MKKQWLEKWHKIPKAAAWYAGTRLSYILNQPLLPPFSCVFSLTKRCNSSCSYCGIWAAPKPPDPSFDEVVQVLRQLRDLSVREVVFSGGEPLLRKDIVEIVEVGARLGLKTNLLTNARLLNTTLTSELVNAGLGIMTVSLDSLEPDIYKNLRGISLERVLQGLSSLISIDQSKTRVHLTCVLTMLNLDGLSDLAQFAQEHQFGLLFQPFNEIPGNPQPELLPNAENVQQLEEAIEKVIKLKEQGASILSSEYYLRSIPKFMSSRHILFDGYHCTAGFIGLNIDSNLDVLPCWSLPPSGNLRTASLKEIWTSQQFYDLRLKMKRMECPGCWLICHTERRPPL
jgi:MoaA/NifB/PqqE/SkfB family radical SAM enzyme